MLHKKKIIHGRIQNKIQNKNKTEEIQDRFVSEAYFKQFLCVHRMNLKEKINGIGMTFALDQYMHGLLPNC